MNENKINTSPTKVTEYAKFVENKFNVNIPGNILIEATSNHWAYLPQGGW